LSYGIVQRIGVVSAIVFAGGCAGPHEAALATALEDNGYISHQGTLLLGFVEPDVRHLAFPSAADPLSIADDGELVTGLGGGAAVVGLTFQALGSRATVDMRIVGTVPPANIGERWRYALEAFDAAHGWMPACADPPSLAPRATGGPVLAVAFPGRIGAAGAYIDDRTAVGFACETGVVAKCMGWGYDPTKAPPQATLHGVATTTTGADMLLACTRMARADYCAAGVPHTVDGTPVHVHDVFGGPPSDGPPVSGFAFEAAWPAVALGAEGTAPPQPALCLSKLRWSTLPLGGDCPNDLLDPRVSINGHFCEDIDPVELDRRGALVLVDSPYLDVGLYRWEDPASAARLSTAQLVPGVTGSLPSWRGAPIPGVGFPLPGQPGHFEGALLDPGLSLPGLTDDTLHLASFRCGDDYVTTTTSNVKPSCKRLADEGLVFPPNTPGRSKLRRFWNPSSGRSQTTTMSPATLIARGWQLVEVVGGMVRASVAINVRWDAVAGATYALDVQTRTGEWIAPCFDAATVGTATGVTIDGGCPAAPGRSLTSGEIVALRVNVQRSASTDPHTLVYDGVSTDVYLPLPGGRPTALVLGWNALADTRYVVDLHASASWLRCAGERFVANDVDVVLPGVCPETGGAFDPTLVDKVRVCSEDASRCAEAVLDGKSAFIRLTL
jgi:hypothetical protein